MFRAFGRWEVGPPAAECAPRHGMTFGRLPLPSAGGGSGNNDLTSGFMSTNGFCCTIFDFLRLLRMIIYVAKTGSKIASQSEVSAFSSIGRANDS